MEVQTIEAAKRPFSPELAQEILDQMTFRLDNGKVCIGTGQSSLPGNVIDFGNAAVLNAQIKAAQLLGEGIENLVREFEAAPKSKALK